MERLFIYGTLAPGRPNHHVVEDIPGNWEEATLKGTLLNEGCWSRFSRDRTVRWRRRGNGFRFFIESLIWILVDVGWIWGSGLRTSARSS